MSRKYWVRLLVASTGLGLLGLVPAPAQADSYDGGTDYPYGTECVISAETNPDGVIDSVPPLPYCFDPAGTAEDEALAGSSDPRWSYTVGPWQNYESLYGDQPYMTHGATIVVEVLDNNPPGGQLPNISKTQFVLTYPNTADVTPADNVFSFEVGLDCLQDSGGTNYRTLTTSVEEVADPGKAYTQYVKPQASESTGSFATEGDQATRIMDGTRVDGLAVMTTAGDREGLRSGRTWELKFKVRDVPGGALYTAHTENVVVPPCPGDSVVQPPPPKPKVFPKAKIYRMKPHALKVVMDKGSLKVGKFKIKVKKPPKRKKPKSSFHQFTSQTKSKWKTGLPYRTKVTVMAKYKRWGVLKWRVVKRYKVVRIGS